ERRGRRQGVEPGLAPGGRKAPLLPDGAAYGALAQRARFERGARRKRSRHGPVEVRDEAVSNLGPLAQQAPQVSAAAGRVPLELAGVEADAHPASAAEDALVERQRLARARVPVESPAGLEALHALLLA